MVSGRTTCAAPRSQAGWNFRKVQGAPRYLIRDRDTEYGPIFRQRLRAMGIRDKPAAPRSPWQNPYVERLIGTIRRECLGQMIVFGEAHLRRNLDAARPLSAAAGIAGDAARSVCRVL